MNAEPDSGNKFVGDGAIGQRRYRILAGVALSLVAHVLLLFGWRHSLAPRPVEVGPELRSIAVWLRPPPPPPAPAEPAAAPTPKPPPERQAGAARRLAKSTELIAIPHAPDTPAPPDAFTVEQAPLDAAPRFDSEAAKQLARKMANEPDPARAGTAVGQIPPKPLETETKAARAIAQAKRRDCKDGVPGGLLAPLFLMMDKKDGGCKW